MNKGNKWKMKPGPAVKQFEMIRVRTKLHEFFTRRLSGGWIKRGVLAIDDEGDRHMIVDDGLSLFIDGTRIECKENPLPALAQILSERKLILLDWQMLSRNVMLSASEATNYIKESGMQVSATDGILFRYQDGNIMTGKEIVIELMEGEYLPETALLLFSSLDTQLIAPEGELVRAMRETKGALPG